VNQEYEYPEQVKKAGAVVAQLVFPVNLGSVNGFGITKRELFAAMAMQGILSSDANYGLYESAEKAVRSADSLLAELNKP
jgi:hypothetical protein